MEIRMVWELVVSRGEVCDVGHPAREGQMDPAREGRSFKSARPT